MCLGLKNKGGGRVSKKDRIVFKVITIDNHSEFTDFSYKPNKLYTLKRKIEIVDNEIEEGFHAYLPGHFRLPDFRYGSVTSAYKRISKKLVQFIIPAGTKYFLGDSDDIVAERIRSCDLIPLDGAKFYALTGKDLIRGY